MTAPLTLIVEGKPLVFDVPVSVGEVIPAGTWFCTFDADDRPCIEFNEDEYTVPLHTRARWFTARPPVAPESFADGDVAWVRVERVNKFSWEDPDGDEIDAPDRSIRNWIDAGHAFTTTPPRPESLADVLDDANLPDELRARIEKAVGVNG